jgi:hypothetical protein
VDDAVPVRVVDGAGDLFEARGGLARRQRAVAEHLRERRPGDVLHRVVRHAAVLAGVVDLHDVRVPQAGRRLGLPAEARRQLHPGAGGGRQQLQRHLAVQAFLTRLVDDAHPALAQHLQQLVAGDLRRGARRAGRVVPAEGGGDGVRVAGEARSVLGLARRLARLAAVEQFETN